MERRAKIKRILNEVRTGVKAEAMGLKPKPKTKTIITKDGFIKDGVVYHTIGKSGADTSPKKNR